MLAGVIYSVVGLGTGHTGAQLWIRRHNIVVKGSVSAIAVSLLLAASRAKGH